MFTEFPIKTVDTMQDEWKLGHAGRMGYLDVIAGLTAEPL